MTTRWPAILLVAGLVFVAGPQVRGQDWSVDLSAGRTVYEPLSVQVGANNLTGTIRYDVRDAWIYGAAAAPLGDQDFFWTAAGAGGRFMLRGSEGRHATIGLDLGSQGFLFHDPLAAQTGTGGVLEAMPFARLSAGAGHIDLRGGWRGQTLALVGERQSRDLFETGVRMVYGRLVRVEGEARWVHADEGTFPFVGTSVMYVGSTLQTWVRAGKWMDTELNEVTWGAGASYSVSGRLSVWTALRQDAPDPLYWNAPRKGWSVGVTHRWGRDARLLLPSTRARAGRVEIRIPAALADNTSALSIAGSFNGWQPLEMHLEGREWIVHVPLAPGVYEFAFRTADGRWFVPESMPGRRSDGMGGHLAVLVVS